MRVSRTVLLLAAVPLVFVGRRLLLHLVEQDQGSLALLTTAVKGATSWAGGLGMAALVGASTVGAELRLCGSTGMRAVRALVRKVAGTGAGVVLRGESGVGKEVVARAIHAASPRADHDFVKVNCATLSRELLESELFGHERGAFTSAHARRIGWFERAHQGTLFLDEITELPLELQAKLLHVLQDGRFFRVGGSKAVETDVHLIVASNRDLAAAVRDGAFRPDLFYRLSVVEIAIPPLRERREEIPLLAEHFRRALNAEYGRDVPIPADVLELFDRYPWPGNVRELRNLVHRIVVLGGADAVRAELTAKLHGDGLPARAPVAARPSPPSADGLKAVARQAAREAERAAIQTVLERVRWNRAKAARLLGISYKALRYKLVDVGLVDAPSPADGDGAPARYTRETASPR